MGERIKVRRLELGLNQDVVAPQIGRSVRWYVDLESGRIDPPLHVLRDLAVVLRTTIDWIISDPPVSHPRRNALPAAGTMADEEDEDTKRRAFLAFVAALGSGLIDAERITASAIDGLYMRDAEAITLRLLDQWYATAPSMLLPPVLAHLRGLQGALPGPHELESLTGRTALLAGHLLTMLQRLGEARSCYALTESLARDIGDTDLEIAALICRSALHDWRRGRDARRSAELVHGAAGLVNPGTSPHLQVWVLARRAEEHAVVGDGLNFQRDMAAAEAALRPGADHWYGPRDAAELAAVRGASELLLGRHRDAAETLTWTLDRMNASAVNWRALVAADRDAALAAS
jgi:transcriptional regulator with XRE-family HTH domain